MAKKVYKLHKKKWHEGPNFKFRIGGPKKGEEITVNVTGSSRPLKGVDLCKHVLKAFEYFKGTAGTRILDFGAGTWLRYVKKVSDSMSYKLLYAVEYEQAFQNQDADVQKRYKELKDKLTIWTPKDFDSRKNRKNRFDLILLVNVFNTLPDEALREAIFRVLARRLSPGGWLLVYQRIWSKGENPPQYFEYKDGWIIPQRHFSYYTYRAKTGVKWFNRMAQSENLRIVQTPIEIKSSNTIFRIWEKRFG